MRLRLLTGILLSSTVALAACGNQTSTPDMPSDGPRILSAGEKSDNFLSQSAQEYFVRGSTTVEIEAELTDATEDERLARAAELVPFKQIVIGWFLNAYLIDKSDHDDNSSYGGMKALTKNDSYESLNVRHVEGNTYAFDFVQEIGGQLDLLAELGERANATPHEDGTWSLELQIGKISTEEMLRLESGSEWYRSAPWSGFNPETVDAERLETVELNLEEQERSTDAWIDYPRLVADGTVDISVFFGWDYHDAYHLKHSKTVYQALVADGFAPPVDDFAEYPANRGALTKTLNVAGEDVEFRITLWWGQPETETDPDTDAGGIILENKMREAFARDEVIMFSGHSGSFYGFALANWRMTDEGDLDDSEVRGLDMPADKYQLVLAEGCDTYALGEAFWGNPNKSSQTSLDIVTTTSFSNAGTANSVLDFLRAVTDDDGDGNLLAYKYTDLLTDLDGNSSWFDTMYGVHGLDDNPTANPLTDATLSCAECATDSDCGVNGSCVAVDGGGACLVPCTSTDGCDAGTVCRESESSGYLSESYCVPESLSCN